MQKKGLGKKALKIISDIEPKLVTNSIQSTVATQNKPPASASRNQLNQLKAALLFFFLILLLVWGLVGHLLWRPSSLYPHLSWKGGTWTQTWVQRPDVVGPGPVWQASPAACLESRLHRCHYDGSCSRCSWGTSGLGVSLWPAKRPILGLPCPVLWQWTLNPSSGHWPTLNFSDIFKSHGLRKAWWIKIL